MKQKISPHGAREWSEARQRAETYLRALRGTFGAAESQLLAQVLVTARERPDAAVHPVTLLIESLFALLSAEAAATPVAMTPPIQRVTMLPEKTEFPFHDGLRRLFRTQLLPFAGVR
jgi:hypothetical protein